MGPFVACRAVLCLVHGFALGFQKVEPAEGESPPARAPCRKCRQACVRLPSCSATHAVASSACSFDLARTTITAVDRTPTATQTCSTTSGAAMSDTCANLRSPTWKTSATSKLRTARHVPAARSWRQSVCRLRAVRRDAGASRHACSNERNEVKDAEMARRADARRKAWARIYPFWQNQSKKFETCRRCASTRSSLLLSCHA